LPIVMKKAREVGLQRDRVEDTIRLVPRDSKSVLEIGARDCYVSRLLTCVAESVTALDLEIPTIDHDRIIPVAGDVTSLAFEDNTFDVVFCTEVLQHIPPTLLQTACDEISRVSSRFILIGVPYKQDLRVGRTKCGTCGKRNPPWAHLSAFDKPRLMGLFGKLELIQESFVGQTRERTNFLSTLLMDMAGNPNGTYHQDERCVHCGAKHVRPGERTLLQKALTRAAFVIRTMQLRFVTPRPIWINVLFQKNQTG